MRPTEYPDFGLTEEQRHEATFGHYYEYPGMDGERGEIWCYTDRFSYRPGDTAAFKVSSTAPRFDIAIARDGAAETPVWSRSGIAARWQDTPKATVAAAVKRLCDGGMRVHGVLLTQVDVERYASFQSFRAPSSAYRIRKYYADFD